VSSFWDTVPISDYRDDHIAHKPDPHVVRTVLIGADQVARIRPLRLHGKPHDRISPQTRHLRDLLDEIDAYIRAFVMLIVLNGDKARIDMWKDAG
jgi:hypothetical protein